MSLPTRKVPRVVGMGCLVLDKVLTERGRKSILSCVFFSCPWTVISSQSILGDRHFGALSDFSFLFMSPLLQTHQRLNEFLVLLG